MHHHGGEQHEANDPQRRDIPCRMQKRRVMVDLIAVGGEDLQVAEHVSQDVSEQDQPGYSHHCLLADGGGVKANCSMDRFRSGSAAPREQGLRRGLRFQIPV